VSARTQAASAALDEAWAAVQKTAEWIAFIAARKVFNESRKEDRADG